MEVWISTLGETRTQIVIEAPWPPELHQLIIRPEWAAQPAEIEVGDRRFDDQFFVGGPAKLVLALLDAETRRLLFHATFHGRLDISRGKLRMVQIPDGLVPDALTLLLDVGRRFSRPLDIPRQLAENAHQDPVPWVRLQNLRLLIRELPENPATGEALRKACSDPSPEVRLLVAKEMGAEGRGILLELLEGLQSDAVSAEVFSILEPELTLERTKALLDRALSQRHLRTAHACLEAIGRRGDPATVEMLAKALESEHGELAPTAAWALGATGSPAAEPPLIAALQRDHAALRVFAANALGRVGSVAAVLPLKETAALYVLGDVPKAAREAIAAIQSRVQGASPGQLSLTGPVGQLSLASDPAGRVSISGEVSEPEP